MTTRTEDAESSAASPRRRRVLRRVLRVLEERQRVQDVGYGLLVSALAMAAPSGVPYAAGDEAARRLSGDADRSAGSSAGPEP